MINKNHGLFFTAIFFQFFVSSAVFAQSVSSDENSLPQNFRGKVVYEGIFEGTRTIPVRASRRYGLLTTEGADSSEPYQGGFYLELEYNGDLIKGVWRQQGMFAGSGTLTGTRSGASCQWVSNFGFKTIGDCGKKKIVGKAEGLDNRGRRYKTSIDLIATNLIDYVERDKLLAEKAEKAKIAAAEAAARYAALPSAGAALTQKFEQLVRQDSQGWAFNRYDYGSLTNVKIVSGKAGVGTYVMRGEYTYNGGAKGSVMVEMIGSKFNCIQFWDAVVGCRGLRSAAQGQAMRDLAVGALANGMGSGSGASRGRCDSNCQDERAIIYQQENRRQGLNDNGTPK